jgi:hypothetical protein
MSAECDKHGIDLYWREGEYNAPGGCYACDLDRARSLIEAARAYRDAITEIRALPDWPLEMKAKYMIAVNEADHALHEAARTLEGHVEEGKTHGA